MSTTLDDLRDLPGFIYVATPYSKYHLGHTLAYIHAAKATAKLQQMGFVALSPIAHSHPVAVFGNIDAMDWEHWQKQNEPLMRAAAALVVVQMPGWDESVGVLAEIEHFIAADKPVVFWEWTK